MILGYARVSTADQNLDLQRDALAKAGAEQIYEEHASGARTDRPVLADVISRLRPGDKLVVWKLDRLGRSTKALIDLVDTFEATGVQFESVTDKIDTTTPAGRCFFTILAAIAEMERGLIRERTNAGLKTARSRGRFGGRKNKLSASQEAAVLAALGRPDTNVSELAEAFGVNRKTIYRVQWRAQGRTDGRMRAAEGRRTQA
jgi:DNA invertase Pin-like site-specific DNA recombinase